MLHPSLLGMKGTLRENPNQGSSHVILEGIPAAPGKSTLYRYPKVKAAVSP